MKPNRQIESMSRFTIGEFTVRVWRTEGSEMEAQFTEREDLYALADILREEDATLGVIAKNFASMKNVAAVEVLRPNGNGVLIYPDWK